MIAKRLARWVLRMRGWGLEGEPPALQKFVLIAFPHTSNWDFFYLMLLAAAYDVKISWVGKHSLFRWPFGGVLRMLGGIPVRRDRRSNFVTQMVAAFATAERFVLVVPAEGTRRRAQHWKSGFYHIARSASVPVVLGYLDYRRRRGGFGPALVPSGDVRADMDVVRAFYADKAGKYPSNSTPIRLLDES
jgi:1-acyl-sn-glycerol-3-phosphate acyltransferase